MINRVRNVAKSCTKLVRPITNQLLYQLSYAGKKCHSGSERVLFPQAPTPKAFARKRRGALQDTATERRGYKNVGGTLASRL